ncbi:hypothetical protein ACLBWP_05365 [Microbacterium sp. M1A1_1b]
MRTRLIGRGTLTGFQVGVAWAAGLWIAVVAVVPTTDRDRAADFAVAAAALAPALVLVATAVGTVLAAIVAPVLARRGPFRSTVLTVFALVAFCCWGFVAQVVPADLLLRLPADGATGNTVVLIVTAVGAVVGTAASLVGAVRPLRRPTAAVVRLVTATTVLGAAAGLLGWWLRRGNTSWASGLPASGDFIGAGFAQVDLDADWVWGVVTGAMLGVLVGVGAAWTGPRVSVVPIAALAAAGAAFVTSVTGVAFPAIDFGAPIARFPSIVSLAWSTGTLRPGEIAVTVVVWAAAGALFGVLGLGLERVTRGGAPRAGGPMVPPTPAG